MEPEETGYQPALPARGWCLWLEPQGLPSSWAVTRDCGAGVGGTDIKVIKGEAIGFDKGLDLGNRGHWEVKCLGADLDSAGLSAMPGVGTQSWETFVFNFTGFEF